MCGIFGLLNKNINTTYHYTDDAVNVSFMHGKSRGPRKFKIS